MTGAHPTTEPVAFERIVTMQPAFHKVHDENHPAFRLVRVTVSESERT